ncbi:hypothetical protein LTR78_002613 [Recurvomyces mirabilis]|uniref:Uncharacterized protein n=1 Tax=Recurvomyces mirabilis TaxID=574656 RepID=A0AAE0WTZ2_9PEZI|nr:hypothetical protein LTR78_002613 [Recurvomyces mirabilis]KAK5157542.1 hypothetical protein LTS14_004307 [Recurvomyces mirabilis]
MEMTADLYHRWGQPGDEGRRENEVTIREALAKGFASDLDRSQRVVTLTNPNQAIDTGGVYGFTAGIARQQGGVLLANPGIQGVGEHNNVSMEEDANSQQEDDYDELYNVTPPGQAHPVSRPLQPLLTVLSPHPGREGLPGLAYPSLTPPGQSSSVGSAQIGDNRDHTPSGQGYGVVGPSNTDLAAAMPAGATGGDGAHTQTAGLLRPMEDYQLQLLTALGSERYAPMMEGNIDGNCRGEEKAGDGTGEERSGSLQ